MKKVLTGIVTSAKTKKTITVKVLSKVRHPKYLKYVTKLNKYHAHDEKMEAKEGSTVEIVACRPMSATKRWRLHRIVN